MLTNPSSTLATHVFIMWYGDVIKINIRIFSPIIPPNIVIINYLLANMQSKLCNQVRAGFVNTTILNKHMNVASRWTSRADEDLVSVSITQERKGHQGDSPGIHWRRWRVSSMYPTKTRAVTLKTSPFHWNGEVVRVHKIWTLLSFLFFWLCIYTYTYTYIHTHIHMHT